MIIWSGAFEDISGYSTASRDYIKAFYEAGVDIKVHFRSYDHRGSNRDLIVKEELELCDKLRISNIKKDSNFNWICHSSPNAAFTVPARKNILYSVWESSKIPVIFKPYLDKFDFIMTASEFSKNAFLTTCPHLDIKCLVYTQSSFFSIYSWTSFN